MAVQCWNKCMRISSIPKILNSFSSEPWIRHLSFRATGIVLVQHSSQEATLFRASHYRYLPPMSSNSPPSSTSCIVGSDMSTSASANGENEDEITVQHAKKIFNSAVSAVLPHEMIKRHLQFDSESSVLTVYQRRYELHNNVHVVGFGKAVVGMVRAMEDLIGQHVVQGVVSVPVGATYALRENAKFDMIPLPNSKVKVVEGAANNLPDEEALQAATEIKDVAQRVGEGDILLVLISGGGSALLPMPHPPVSLDDIMQLSKDMSRAGADIKQLNYMRKQVEVLKGGGLATLAYPAKVLALILSDVIGDPLDFIASGPTVIDSSTPQGCLSLFSKLGIDNKVPQPVVDFLRRDDGQSPSAANTHVWSKVHNVLIGSNSLACDSAALTSEELGYLPFVLTTELDGEAKVVGSLFAALALYVSSHLNLSLYDEKRIESIRCELTEEFNFRSNQLDEITVLIDRCKKEKKGVAIITGGETTVTVRGGGRGGRNQEMAVSSALGLEKLMAYGDTPLPVSVAFLSGGTDGQDGPTPAAGGVVTPDFVNHSRQSGFDVQQYLVENDSYTLLKAIKEGRYLLDTGLTGTNVMDINLLLVRDKRY